MKTKANNKPIKPAIQVDEKAILQEQIAQRAHELWRQRGCEHGNDLADWLQAQWEINELNQTRLKVETSTETG